MPNNDATETGPGARRQPRSSLFLAAVMRAGPEQVPVTVRNMSLNGALVDSPVAPPAGTEIQLIRGSLIASGSVAWSSAGRCGLRFRSEISIKDWLASPAKAEQQRVDEIVSLVKAGAIPIGFAEINRPKGHGGGTGTEVALGLEDALRLLEDLENDLASSKETLGRHGPKLQNLDIATQMIRAVLRELSAADGEVNPGTAALEDLRIVCAQALSDK